MFVFGVPRELHCRTSSPRVVFAGPQYFAQDNIERPGTPLKLNNATNMTRWTHTA